MTQDKKWPKAGNLPSSGENQNELSLLNIELKLQIFVTKNCAKICLWNYYHKSSLFLQNHCYTFFLY